MGELDTGKLKFRQGRFWTSLCLTVRIAVSSHSLVIGHQPDLLPLPREMAINPITSRKAYTEA